LGYDDYAFSELPKFAEDPLADGPRHLRSSWGQNVLRLLDQEGMAQRGLFFPGDDIVVDRLEQQVREY